jgi:hypothetical protein
MLRLFKAPENADRDLVREIAERVATQLRSQVVPHAGRMSTAELRGYVRAGGRALIRQEFQAAEFRGLSSTDKRQAEETQVLEQVVHDVVRSLIAVPISSIPLPHILVRHAA